MDKDSSSEVLMMQSFLAPNVASRRGDSSNLHENLLQKMSKKHRGDRCRCAACKSPTVPGDQVLWGLICPAMRNEAARDRRAREEKLMPALASAARLERLGKDAEAGIYSG